MQWSTWTLECGGAFQSWTRQAAPRTWGALPSALPWGSTPVQHTSGWSRQVHGRATCHEAARLGVMAGAPGLLRQAPPAVLPRQLNSTVRLARPLYVTCLPQTSPNFAAALQHR